MAGGSRTGRRFAVVLIAFCSALTLGFITTAPWSLGSLRVTRLETVLAIWPLAAIAGFAHGPTRRFLRSLLDRDVELSRRTVLVTLLLVAAFLLRVVVGKWLALEVNAWDFSLSFDRPLERTLRGELLWSEDLRHSMLAVHCNWLLLALVPLYAIAASPWWLLVAQPLAIALAAFVLFRLLRETAADDFVAACGALAFVLNRYTAKAVQFPFIIDVFYPLALFLLLLAFVRRSTRLAAVALLLCVSIKEDAIVPLAGVALLAFAGRRWRFGLAVLVVALTVFAIDFFVVIPGFAHWQGAAYAANWSSYGSTPLDAVGGMLASPLRVVGRSLSGARDVFASLLLVPVAGWPWLVAALPPLLVYGSADADKVHFFVLHYSMPFLPALFAALPAGIERISRLWKGSRVSRRVIALAVLTMSALLGTSYEFESSRPERRLIKPLIASAGAGDVYVQGALLPHAGYSPHVHALHHGVVAAKNAAYLICETCDPYPFSREELASVIEGIRSRGPLEEMRSGALLLLRPRS